MHRSSLSPENGESERLVISIVLVTKSTSVRPRLAVATEATHIETPNRQAAPRPTHRFTSRSNLADCLGRVGAFAWLTGLVYLMSAHWILAMLEWSSRDEHETSNSGRDLNDPEIRRELEDP